MKQIFTTEQYIKQLLEIIDNLKKITQIEKTTCYIKPLSRKIDLHFYIYVPPIKDHLLYKTTFCGPIG